MKKTMAKLLSLLLIFSIILPQTAFAASYYYMTVTLSGPDRNGVNQVVTRKSNNYLSWPDTTLATFAQLMYKDGVDEEINEKFDGTGLNDTYYDLYKAAAKAIDIESPDATAWNQWVDNCVEGDAGKGILKNLNSNLYSLDFIGGKIVAHFRGGNTNGLYTVVIELVCHYEDNYRDDHKVDGFEVREQYKGKIIVDHPTAPEGETVHIYTYPDKEEMVSFIKVVDQYGQPVKVTYLGNGEFDFVMPDCGVVVSGKFQPTPEDPSVTGIADVLETSNHEPFMIGDDENLFRPKANVRRSEVAQMFYRLLKNKNVTATASFADVSPDAWYASAVGTLAALGIVEGVSDTDFQPNRSITRAEFAAICARFAKAMQTGKTFTDVSFDYWAKDVISTAATYGWIQGYSDGTFAPRQAITREEAAAIVNRMLYRLGDQIAIDDGETREFPDVHYSMWSWYEIAEATYDHNHTYEEKFIHEFWVEIAKQ